MEGWPEYDDYALALRSPQQSLPPLDKFQKDRGLFPGSLLIFQVGPRYLKHLYGESYHALFWPLLSLWRHQSFYQLLPEPLVGALVKNQIGSGLVPVQLLI